MKSTPGPWKYHKCDATGEHNPPQRMYVVAMGEHKGVVVDEVCPCCADNQEANARLIASSPDLLKALRGMVVIVSMYPDVYNQHIEEIEYYHSLLEKAEGRDEG